MFFTPANKMQACSRLYTVSILVDSFNNCHGNNFDLNRMSSDPCALTYSRFLCHLKKTTTQRLRYRYTYISLCKYGKLHSFKDRFDKSVFLPFSAKKLKSLCVSQNVYSNYHVCPSSLTLQACTGAFCKGIPFTLSMRHRFTVAGNYERLFLFIYFLSLMFFSATKLLHEVCLKTNSVPSGIC